MVRSVERLPHLPSFQELATPRSSPAPQGTKAMSPTARAELPPHFMEPGAESRPHVSRRSSELEVARELPPPKRARTAEAQSSPASPADEPFQMPDPPARPARPPRSRVGPKLEAILANQASIRSHALSHFDCTPTPTARRQVQALADRTSRLVDATKFMRWKNPAQRPSLTPEDVSDFHARITAAVNAIKAHQAGLLSPSSTMPLEEKVFHLRNYPPLTNRAVHSLSDAYRLNFPSQKTSAQHAPTTSAQPTTESGDAPRVLDLPQFEKRINLLLSRAHDQDYKAAYGYVSKALMYHGEHAFKDGIDQVYSDHDLTIAPDVQANFPLRLQALLRACNVVPDDLATLINATDQCVGTALIGQFDGDAEKEQSIRKKEVGMLLNGSLLNLIHDALRDMPSPQINQADWMQVKAHDLQILKMLIADRADEPYFQQNPHVRSACLAAIDDFVRGAINRSSVDTLEDWFIAPD